MIRATSSVPRHGTWRGRPRSIPAFGAGSHNRLGQHIARIEIDAMLVEVADPNEGLRAGRAVERLASNFISGPTHMPIRFRRRT